MRQFQIAPGGREARDHARPVVRDAVHRFRALEAPALRERACIDGIEAEPIDQCTHHVSRLLIVGG
jgi:hypothetical protein